MQAKTRWIILIVSFLVLTAATYHSESFWGFYSHRLINKTAIFTLPVALLPLYKDNIDYVTEHAIDPDKRRYASSLEAVRHYIDLDIWGSLPFDHLPRELAPAMLLYSSISVVHSENRDTVAQWKGLSQWQEYFMPYQYQRISADLTQRTIEIQENGYILLPDDWLPDAFDPATYDLLLTEQFSRRGILPYHLVVYQNRLTIAFREKDWSQVMLLSTELGHYIADAHVPLHTTVNYNGQLSDQDGIHAFWESRIPELFASENYNLFVDKAKYIEDIQSWVWSIVLHSHSLVDEVLQKELEVRSTIQGDQQYCFDERGNATVRLECRAYAAAYEAALSGMVERQMRAAIHNIGSAWFTAWVNAGRPNYSDSLPVITWVSEDTLELPDSNTHKPNRRIIHHIPNHTPEE